MDIKYPNRPPQTSSNTIRGALDRQQPGRPTTSSRCMDSKQIVTCCLETVFQLAYTVLAIPVHLPQEMAKLEVLLFVIFMVELIKVFSCSPPPIFENERRSSLSKAGLLTSFSPSFTLKMHRSDLIRRANFNLNVIGSNQFIFIGFYSASLANDPSLSTSTRLLT